MKIFFLCSLDPTTLQILKSQLILKKKELGKTFERIPYSVGVKKIALWDLLLCKKIKFI